MSNGVEFFQTMMGRKFYEADVPRIIAAIERLASAVELSVMPPKPLLVIVDEVLRTHDGCSLDEVEDRVKVRNALLAALTAKP